MPRVSWSGPFWRCMLHVQFFQNYCFISTLQPVSWSWELRSSEVYIFPYGRKKAPKPRQVAFHFMFINFVASFFQMKCEQPVGMTWVHFLFQIRFLCFYWGKKFYLLCSIWFNKILFYSFMFLLWSAY